MSDPTCVKTFLNRYEADLAKGFLESQGIEAFVSADDSGGMRPALAFSGGVGLMVKNEDAEEALGILESIEK